MRCSQYALSLGVLAALAAAPATRPTETSTAAPVSAPATAPAGDDVDWLLSQGAPAAHPPTDRDLPRPATRPSSPFAIHADPDLRRGIITLSNGERITAMIRHTQGKPLRAWVEVSSEYRDVPFSLIKSIEAKIDWERDEREWHFKESGSDIKEYSGKTYPARQLQYTITLKNGQAVTGGVVEPLYVQAADGEVLFGLHKRDKGEVGQSLKELVYVRRVELTEEVATPAAAASATKPADGGPAVDPSH